MYVGPTTTLILCLYCLTIDYTYHVCTTTLTVTRCIYCVCVFLIIAHACLFYTYYVKNVLLALNVSLHCLHQLLFHYDTTVVETIVSFN